MDTFAYKAQRQQEEEAHQGDHDHQMMVVAAAFKVMVIQAANMADHRQEEELGQEEARDQEEQDHLHRTRGHPTTADRRSR